MLVLQPAARFLDVPQVGFVTRHLRVSRVERSLGGVERIARLVVLRACRFEARLELPQMGILRLELVAGLRDLPRVALALGGDVAPAQEPEQLRLSCRSEWYSR